MKSVKCKPYVRFTPKEMNPNCYAYRGSHYKSFAVYEIIDFKWKLEKRETRPYAILTIYPHHYFGSGGGIFFYILFFNTKHKHITHNTMEDSCLHSVHSLRHELDKFASLCSQFCLAYPWLVHSLRFSNYPIGGTLSLVF